MSSNRRLPSTKPAIKNHLLRTLNVKLGQILEDPRSAVNRQWDFGYVMQMLFFGILSGCKTLREVETFSEGYDERIPDTTLNDTIVEVNAEPLRAAIAREVKQALREHELPKDEFPLRITAIDGKCASVSTESVGEFSQKSDNGTKEYYVNRVLRAFHVSNATKLFIGQREIHGKLSETTELRPFIDTLMADYGKTELLEVFSMDAGMTSKENANYIIKRERNYIMGLKGPQQVLLANARKLLSDRSEPDSQTIDTANGKTVTRKLYRTLVPKEDNHGWTHLEEFWLTDQCTVDNKTGSEETEKRYFLSSIAADKLTASEVQQAIRMHWGIENDGNWIFDVVLGEDDYPFANRAIKLISLIRLYAYNIISRLINRRLRKARARKLSWGNIIHLIQIILHELRQCKEFQTYLSPAFV